MGIGSDIAAFSAKLDAAIYSVMDVDVADEVKEEMSKHLESYTYTRSRGPSGGGVRDKRNFHAYTEQSGDTTTLKVRDEAPFQHTPRGRKSLAKVVETGDPSYKMPGPRPFLAPTQEEMDGGLAKATVLNGLKNRGFTIE